MCGRYTLYDFNGMADRFEIDQADIELLLGFEENYNITPSQANPVVIRNSPNHIELMQWGFIPSWEKESDKGFKLINARAETVAEKPMFKKALEGNRCLVPANGFYEWKVTKAGKVPYFIRLKSDSLFAFAGIYSVTKNRDNKEIKSYAIITTMPNELMANIHNRMPVILSKENEDIWLDKDLQDSEVLTALLQPYDERLMEAYPVSSKVNNPSNNQQELIEKVEFPTNQN